MVAGKEKDARADNVSSARHSFTLVTSLWGNGEVGPLTIVLPLGFLKDEERADLERRFKPDVFFVSSGRASHFMNAEVVVQFFDHVLVEAFDQRRRVLGERYGQSFESEWGLILCDSFTGHHSTSGGADVQRCLAKYLIYIATHIYIYIQICWGKQLIMCVLCSKQNLILLSAQQSLLDLYSGCENQIYKPFGDDIKVWTVGKTPIWGALKIQPIPKAFSMVQKDLTDLAPEFCVCFFK